MEQGERRRRRSASVSLRKSVRCVPAVCPAGGSAGSPRHRASPDLGSAVRLPGDRKRGTSSPMIGSARRGRISQSRKGFAASSSRVIRTRCAACCSLRPARSDEIGLTFGEDNPPRMHGGRPRIRKVQQSSCPFSKGLPSHRWHPDTIGTHRQAGDGIPDDARREGRRRRHFRPTRRDPAPRPAPAEAGRWAFQLSNCSRNPTGFFEEDGRRSRLSASAERRTPSSVQTIQCANRRPMSAWPRARSQRRTSSRTANTPRRSPTDRRTGTEGRQVRTHPSGARCRRHASAIHREKHVTPRSPIDEVFDPLLRGLPPHQHEAHASDQPATRTIGTPKRPALTPPRPAAPPQGRAGRSRDPRPSRCGGRHRSPRRASCATCR